MSDEDQLVGILHYCKVNNVRITVDGSKDGSLNVDIYVGHLGFHKEYLNEYYDNIARNITKAVQHFKTCDF